MPVVRSGFYVDRHLFISWDDVDDIIHAYVDEKVAWGDSRQKIKRELNDIIRRATTTTTTEETT